MHQRFRRRLPRSILPGRSVIASIHPHFASSMKPPNGPLRLPKVLLLVETSTGYGRGILEGVARYVREHGPWSIFFEERGLLDPPPRWLAGWRGDGIISRTASRAVARRLRAKALPTVELLGFEPYASAKVHGENVSAGQLAAEHLLGCGLRNFAFFSCGDAWWIATYREGFLRGLAERGFGCDFYRPPRTNCRLLPRWMDAQRPAVVAWLSSLPRPLGVFVPQLGDARAIMDICRSLGIAVPEEVAVLGGADDPPVCSVTTPPLSGIDFDSARIGYEAAAMLALMMAGRKPQQGTGSEPSSFNAVAKRLRRGACPFLSPVDRRKPPGGLWIPPVRVVARQSTDVLAISDRDAARAIRFIREHACKGVHVPDVAAAVGLSRRVLERRFRFHLRCTPKQEIRRVQIDRAKALLSQTETPIEYVARSCGFPGFKHFARAFRCATGQTPSAFRQSGSHLTGQTDS